MIHALENAVRIILCSNTQLRWPADLVWLIALEIANSYSVPYQLFSSLKYWLLKYTTYLAKNKLLPFEQKSVVLVLRSSRSSQGLYA